MDIVCKNPHANIWSLCSAPRFSGFPQCDLETEGQMWRAAFSFHYIGMQVLLFIWCFLQTQARWPLASCWFFYLCPPSHCRSPWIRNDWHYIGFLHGIPELDSGSQAFMAIVSTCWAFSLSSAHFSHEDYYTCATLRSPENKTFAIWL